MSNKSSSLSSDETETSISVSSVASIRAKVSPVKKDESSKSTPSKKSRPSVCEKSEDSESGDDDVSDETLENLRSSLDVNSGSLAEDSEKQSNRPASSSIHNHTLPVGWTCNYDVENDEYKFEFIGDKSYKGRMKSFDKRDKETTTKELNDSIIPKARRPTLDFRECKYGYHFPSSPTPSMLSELARQVQKAPSTAPAAKVKQFGYGKTKLTMLSDEEEQAKRLREMFPTATGPVIDQMIRIYQGREGCIKAALISLGYKRATDYGGQQATAQSPIMLMMSKPASKKLFDKLVSYFPDKDETLIKNLMYQHKEVEHEIISILVESSGQSEIVSKDSKSKVGIKHDKNGAIMKLRYLKFLFPTCEEIELYHLLYGYDLDAQKVIEQVEKRGHKRANIDEVMQNRKTQTQQMRAQQAALAAKEKVPLTNPLELHRNRTKPTATEGRINNMKENIKKSLGSDVILITDGLLSSALEASDYNEALAKKFLQEMEPIDESKYKQRYVIECEKKPSVVLYPCKGIQKNGDTSFMSITENEYLSIPKEVVECETALALLKVDASTYTQDDIILTKFTHAKGKNNSLAVGSIFKKLEVKDSLRKGSNNKKLCVGSHYQQVCADENRPATNDKAKGRNKLICLGRKIELNQGHNLKLIQRTHPFFK